MDRLADTCFICGSCKATATDFGSSTSLSVSLPLVRLLDNAWIGARDNNEELINWHQKLDSCSHFQLCAPCQAVLHSFDGLLQQIRALEAQVVLIRDNVLQKLEEASTSAKTNPEIGQLRRDLSEGFRKSSDDPQPLPVSPETVIKAEPDDISDFVMPHSHSPDFEPEDTETIPSQVRDPYSAFVKLVRLDLNRSSKSPAKNEPPQPIWKKYKRPWPCTECDRVLSSKERLQCHLSAIHGIPEHAPNLPYNLKARPFSCTLCPRRFSRQEGLRKHHENAHVNAKKESLTNEKPKPSTVTPPPLDPPAPLPNRLAKNKWPCPECNQVLSSKERVEVHRRARHGVPIPESTRALQFPCPLCPRRFLRGKILKQHLLVVHQVENTEDIAKLKESAVSVPKAKVICDRSFLCELCSMGFASAKGLDHHQRRSHPELELQPYACDVCGKTYCQPSYVLIHKRTVHERRHRYTCSEPGCSYRCWAAYVLERHLAQKHRGERPFVCDQCGAAYKRKIILQEHVRRRHTGERPYVCKECPATFVGAAGLHRHAEIHGDRVHQCPHCDKSFAVKNGLWSHLRVHQPPEEKINKD